MAKRYYVPVPHRTVPYRSVVFRGLIAAYILLRRCHVCTGRDRTVPYGTVGHVCAGIYICCGGTKFEALMFWPTDPPVPGVFGILAIICGLFPCWLLLVRSVDIRRRRDILCCTFFCPEGFCVPNTTLQGRIVAEVRIFLP